MGFRSILVDHVVVVRHEVTGPKVAGETPMGEVLSAEFRGRVDEPTPNELRQDRIQFVQYTRTATMLVGVKDVETVLLALKGSDKLRVLTGIYAGDYEVMGPPSPIRKKRKLLGWEVRLQEPRGRQG